MVNLFKEEIDEKLSKSGQIIEPLIIKYVEEKLNTKYISHDPIAINFDIFSNNKIFGGIPDGEPINEQNKIDYSNGKLMLEIKTSSIDSFVYRKNNGKLEMVLEDELPKIKERYAKRMTWFAEDKIVPPTEYVLQLGLYLYLRDLSEGAIVVSFLNGIDYIKPQEFVANDHEIHVVKISMDKEKFSKYINFATE
jgi:hypothetical protein